MNSLKHARVIFIPLAPCRNVHVSAPKPKTNNTISTPKKIELNVEINLHKMTDIRNPQLWLQTLVWNNRKTEQKNLVLYDLQNSAIDFLKGYNKHSLKNISLFIFQLTLWRTNCWYGVKILNNQSKINSYFDF